MAARALPGLGLIGFWPLGFNGYKDEMDSNLLTLSVITQGTVLSLVAAVPGSPSDGDRHIITGGADANKIAVRDNGAWSYIVPHNGWVMFNLADGTPYRFNGSAWNMDIATGYSDEQAMDAVAAMIAAGTHSGISISYNDAGDGLNFSLSGNVVRTDATANLTKGYTATAHNLGTPVAASTVTPDPTNGNMQRVVNNAAFTLAAPVVANDYTIVIQMTNGAAPGAISYSGFAKVTGDSLTTTTGDDFMLCITKINSFSWLNVVALQ